MRRMDRRRKQGSNLSFNESMFIIFEFSAFQVKYFYDDFIQKDGAVAFMPKIITYKQLGFSELGNGNNHSRRKNEKYFSQSNGINNNTNDFNNKSNNLINSVPARNSIVNNPLMPFVESHSKTVFNTNSRSAFSKTL